MKYDVDNMTPAEIDLMWAEGAQIVAKFRKDFTGTFYALRAGEYIKIGFTRGCILKRMTKLQTGNPIELRIVGIGNGGRFMERHAHKALKPYRAFGEWYRDEPIVREMIKNFIDMGRQS